MERSHAHHPGQGNLDPGDVAPAGTPGTGETLCPDCSGKGQRDGRMCQTCGGTGTVVEAIGGA